LADGLTDSKIMKSLLPDGRKPDFIVVGGPTASGKSSLALELAVALSGEIVCCDSVQIYRGFDLGSAKPSKKERELVPHHLFDEFAWDENCDAAVYAAKAKAAIALIRGKGRLPILVGGTGLYLRALLGQQWDDDIPSDEGLRAQLNERESADLFAQLTALDPRRAGQLHVNDRFRVRRALEINLLTGSPVREPKVSNEEKRSHTMIYLNPPKDVLHLRINERTKVMLDDGLVDEVKGLLSRGVSADCKPMRSIGYKEVAAMLDGRLADSELEAAISLATRQYAKRQTNLYNKVVCDAKLADTQNLPEIVEWVQGLL
jgi:tRNA dimethylallyltransferase